MNRTALEPEEWDSYTPPKAFLVEVGPLQVICGTNEDIIDGGEIDWAPYLNGN